MQRTSGMRAGAVALLVGMLVLGNGCSSSGGERSDAGPGDRAGDRQPGDHPTVDRQARDGQARDRHPRDLPVGDTQQPASESFRVVFAANFGSGKPCHRDSPWGADLYLAEVTDGTSLTAKNLRAIASDPAAAEWFPALSPSGKAVAYNRTLDQRGPRGQSVWVVELERGNDNHLLVEEARFPQFSTDEKRLYFSRSQAGRDDIYLAELSVDAASGRLTAGTPVQLSTAAHAGGQVTDPYQLPGEPRLAVTFQATSDSSAAVGLFDLETSLLSPLTPSDGSGHASCSPGARAIAFGSSGKGVPALVLSEGGAFGPKVQLPAPVSPQAFVADDARYGTAETINWDYPEWAGDQRLVASVQGGHVEGGKRKYSLSRLYLLALPSGYRGDLQVRNLSGPLETLAGKTGSDLCTVSAQALRP